MDGFIDQMLTQPPPADLIREFALQVPSMVICHLLGVPYADHEHFQECSRRLLRSPDLESAEQALQDLQDYLRGLVADKEREPGDGLLDRLITEQLATGGLDREDLVRQALFLLIAGHETTSSMIALGVVTLLEHPDQLAALRADPTTVPGAVEELLRLLSIADASGSRVAAADIEFDGQLIRAGDGVLVSYLLANRDADAFEDPDTFDVRRPARHHVAFGYGVHQCLGQNLARLELEVVFGTLFERIPTLRLAAPVDQLTLHGPGTIQGVTELPVTW